jgi:hypothetical protein
MWKKYLSQSLNVHRVSDERQIELLEIISLGFDVTDQLLNSFFVFVKYWRKLGYHETVHQISINFKKAYDSVRMEVLYSILTEFRIAMKLVRLIKTCLNKTYIKFVTYR